MKPKGYITILLALFLSVMVSGCAQAALAQSNLKRIPDPQVSAADQDELAAGNLAFALDLYQQVRRQDGNLVFSPYSLSLALAMTYAGARGETASQMADVLHFSLPQERLHPAFNALDLSLAAAQAERGVTLDMANSLWAQEDYPFLPDYLDLLAQHYGAGVRLVDYQLNTEAARQAINAWVEKQTRDKIRELFKKGMLNEGTRLALVNAIYFNAEWQTQFDASATKPADFHLLDGRTVQVPMMSTQAEDFRVPFAAGKDYTAVGLPYANPRIELVLLLPGESGFEAFEAGLDAVQLMAILDQMKVDRILLDLPKFKTESEFDLPETLKAMGMVDAFDFLKSDFSGMDGTRDLFITEVVHKAYIDVNEQGTEAAAASGVVMGIISAPPHVQVNRPFIYLIYDRETGTILFLGRVLDPTQ